MYARGDGVKPDALKAAKWLRKAVEAGEKGARRKLEALT